MTEWSVALRYRCEDAQAAIDPDELMDRLEDLAPAVATCDGEVTIRISIEASDGLAAVSAAVEYARLATADKLAEKNMVSIEATESSALEYELSKPSLPALLGVSELAELLSVSRQRVSQLAKSTTFPPPVARLDSGPIWLETTVSRYVVDWCRVPGRRRCVTRSAAQE